MAYISKVKLPNNSIYDLKDSGAHWYGSCSTAAATAAKTCTISGFTLETGTRIVVTFTYGNTAASPTLSINEGSAIPFTLIDENITLWDDGEICEFIYDGMNWNILNYKKNIPNQLKHSITFGANQAYTFDGSADVVVPVYTGTII